MAIGQSPQQLHQKQPHIVHTDVPLQLVHVLPQVLLHKLKHQCENAEGEFADFCGFFEPIGVDNVMEGDNVGVFQVAQEADFADSEKS